MNDKIVAGPINDGDSREFREAVCIHTDKIYDQCRDKDCLTDLRVYLGPCAQELVNKSTSVKIRKAEVIWVYSDIEPVPFNRGYYSIDLRYYFKITLDVYTGTGKPTTVEGLSAFDKKVILFGSEGNAKVFSSKYKNDAFDPQSWQKTNMPKAVIEVVEPIALASKVVDASDSCCCGCEQTDLSAVPTDICCIFEDNLVIDESGKKVLVTIGIFSIVKLERSVQLLIPSYDFCVPCKDCVVASDESPCDLFEKIEFPVDEFFPPATFDCDDDDDDDK